MRRSRSDKNQGAIVDDARSIGASVFVLSQVGHGIMDLLIGFRGSNFLIEVKEDEKADFTEAQKKFWKKWKGQKAIVYTSHEMFIVIGAILGSKKERMEIENRRPR